MANLTTLSVPSTAGFINTFSSFGWESGYGEATCKTSVQPSIASLQFSSERRSALKKFTLLASSELSAKAFLISSIFLRSLTVALIS